VLICEYKPSLVAMLVALEALSGPSSRIYRVAVLFPDIGSSPYVLRVGLFRYANETPYQDNEANARELQLPRALTIHHYRRMTNG
jgi:hypothetical protein